MAEEIVLEDLNCDKTGLQALGAFARGLARSTDSKVRVDCRLVTAIDPNLAAAVAALADRAGAKGQVLEFVNLNLEIRHQLTRNGLFGSRSVHVQKNQIPLKSFPMTGAKDFAEYTSQQFNRFQLPKMSKRLRGKIFEGMDELFNNSVIHSKSAGNIYACGEFYPDSELLDFTIVDLGVGFRRPVERFLGQPMPANEAIDWAMAQGHTTREGDIPGGLGLKILKEFIDLNGGKFIVFSDGGFWSTCRGKVTSEPIKMPFPGTLINLEINMADKSTYWLQGELDPNSLL